MKIKVKLPDGAKIDRDRLTLAIKSVLAGDADKIWSFNEVPAIAQLEESLYERGTTDIQQAWEEIAHLLGLPVGSGLRKSARLELGAENLQDRIQAAFFGE